MPIRFVYMTAGSLEEAENIGRCLVSAGLRGLCQHIPLHELNLAWEGKIEEASEVVMIAKTTEARIAELIPKVKSLHSYTLPCIVSLAVEDGYPPFLEWVSSSVEKG